MEDLQENLVIKLGGGSGLFCFEPPEGRELPTVVAQSLQNLGGYVCLWGFPSGATVQVELYHPSGQLAVSGEYAIQDQSTGASLRFIPAWFANQPTGEWRLVAMSGDTRIEQQLLVEKTRYPVVSAIPASGSRILDSDGWLYCPANSFPPDHQVAIVGASFPPDKDLPLGVYFVEEQQFDAPATLVSSERVITDERGRFETVFQLEPDAQAGLYYPVVLLDPGYQPYFGSTAIGGAVGCFAIADQ